MNERTSSPAAVTIETLPGSVASLRFVGDWTLSAALPDAEAIVAEATRSGGVQQLTVDASALGRWDSVLPAFLYQVAGAASAAGAAPVSYTHLTLPTM